MAERITIELPEPAHVLRGGGLRWLTGWEIHDSDNPRYARVAFEGMEVTLAEFERLALAMLWMVRGHPLGSGLACEVQPTRVPGGGHA